MNYFIFGLIVSLSVLSVGSAAAGRPEPAFSKPYEACARKAGAVDSLMRDCLGGGRVRQDAELNNVYKLLMPKLNRGNKANLLKAERAWIVYRDAHCAVEEPAERAGTLDFVIADQCQLRQTIYRIEDLKQRLEFVRQYPQDDDE